MNTSQTLSIFKREFLGYFRSPVAYVFLVAFLVAGVALAFFVGNFFGENQASLERYFMFYPWLFLFFIPAAGMRLWSEEKRSGSIELLFTLPVTLIEAVMGKFLAAWAFLTIAIALSFPMAVTVGYLGHPDWGVVATSYLGSVLMAGSYLGICSLTSATTRSQVISFVISVLVCVVFVFLGWSVFSPLLEAVLPVALVDLLANFSFITHFEGFLRGIVDLKDVVFFLSLTGFSLFLNVVVLER